MAVAIIGACLLSPAWAVEAEQAEGAAVVFGDTLFLLYATEGSFLPVDRAAAVANRLRSLSEDSLFCPDSISVVEAGRFAEIRHRGLVLVRVAAADAAPHGTSVLETARDHAAAMGRAVSAERRGFPFLALALRLLQMILVIGGFTLAGMGIARAMRWVRARGARLKLPGLRVKAYQLVSPSQMRAGLQLVLKALTMGLELLLLLVLLPVLFSIFPASRGLAAVLWKMILAPLSAAGGGLLSYIDDLLFIAVILVAVRYVVKFLRLLADGIEQGRLHLPRFYPEWANPTFKILRFLLYVFAFIVIFPYLPGSSSPAFQGVTVFLGVLVSLGSSSAVSNIIAGIVITYMRPFKVGDRVKVGEVTGDIVEKSLLVTRIRTIKNEDINIPNAAILSGHTVNYSANSGGGGLILHTTVTIGYDAPWREVHRLLIAATRSVDGVLAEPPPFVLQTALDDFYVRYQLNAHTDRPGQMAEIYSRIHQNIQDEFARAGIQIMSPHYRGDPASTKVPPIGAAATEPSTKQQGERE